MKPQFFPILDPQSHQASRTPAALAVNAVILAAVAGMTWAGWIDLPKIPITITFLVFFATILAATAASRVWGIDSWRYRFLSYLESGVLLLGVAGGLAVTGPSNSMLWSFYVLMVVLFAQGTGPSAAGVIVVAAPMLGLWLVTAMGVTGGHGDWQHIVGPLFLATIMFWYFGRNRSEQLRLVEAGLVAQQELELKTLQLQNERDMRHLEDVWLTTLQQASFSIHLVDAQGRQQAYRGSVDVPLLTIGPGAELELENLVELLKRVASEGPVILFAHPLPDDHFVDIRVVALPEFNAEPRFALLVEGADERVQMERRKQELDQRMVIADRLTALGLLSGGVAHEINNPLTYIGGNIEYLLNNQPELPESVRGQLLDVQQGFRQIERIVHDLRVFSHTGRPGSLEFTDLRLLCERIGRLVHHEIKNAASFQIEMPATPVFVYCRPDQVHQILLNLIINARQAMPEANGSANHIVLRLNLDSQRAIIEVEDNGHGIEPDIMRKIFDPFFTTKGPTTGTGLGLSVCFKLAQEHGGEIYVRSIPHVKTVFTFSLPRGLETQSQHPLLLIIDDEERTRNLFKNVLQDFNVVTAGAVSEALPLLDLPFSAVLCDMRLGDGTGLTIYEQAPPALQKRFVFLTALADGSPELKALPPAVRVLRKPIALDELAACLRVVAGAKVPA